MPCVLIAGSGGREYELGRVFSESYHEPEIHFANGNDAIGAPFLEATNHLIADTPQAFAQLSYDIEADFVVVGSEKKLDVGYIDAVQHEGIAVFGPNQKQALLENSKAVGGEFCRGNNISCPDFDVVTTIDDALDVIAGRPPESYVIKADGPADGKGVILPDSETEARDTLHRMLVDGEYGGSGRERVVIQERLHGPEVSMFIVMDGKGGYSVLPFVQDHKRIGEGDTGLNTGGMGAYLPVDKLLSKDQREKLFAIADKIAKGLLVSGDGYGGVVYAGCMLAEERGGDPVVFEFNARWGDPETQVMMPTLQSEGIDVFDMHLSAAQGELNLPRDLTRASQAAITFALAKQGYPAAPTPELQLIQGLSQPLPSEVLLQFAGVTKKKDKLYASGGRVMHVTALGETLDQATERALSVISPDQIYFNAMQYRKDIGHQLRRKKLTVRG